jgi:hypothetical protein
MLICSVSCIQAQDSLEQSRYTLRGYVKSLQTISLIDNANTSISSNLLHNRISSTVEIVDNLSLRLDMRNRLFWGEMTKYDPTFLPSLQTKPGVLGMSEIIFNSSGFVLHSILDRLAFTYISKEWGITLGRQRINWGIHTAWNPNDVFNTYNLLDFDYEERPGCDALRIQHFGDNHTLELAFKPDTSLNTSIGALLYKTNYSGYDIQFLGGFYKQDYIIGTGWAGNIGDAGFKGECSYFIPMDLTNDAQSSIALSVLFDITFDDGWYCSLGSLYNSNSKTQQSPIIMNKGSLSPKNIFPFETTLFASVNKQLSPINSIGCSVLYSPTHYTLVFMPMIGYNIAENFDIDFIAQSFFAQNVNVQYLNLATSFTLRSRWSF